jgi:uncharacterized protein YecE (DUF72 family)
MEFGKAKSEEVKSVNFELPTDGQHTKKLLTKKSNGKAEVYVGCAKWGRPEWKGFLYPAKTKATDFLTEYCKHFNSIELNAAYYKIPAVEIVRKWKKQAEENSKDNFLFCPKFPLTISHYKKLKNAEAITDQFVTSILEFDNNLGPCLLQMSDKFSPKSFKNLSDFLYALPRDLQVFTELRNEQWYADPESRQEVFKLFAALKQGVVITDVSGRRDLLHMDLTIPEVFIRFNGMGAALRAKDFERIDAWAERLKQWQDKGLKKVYFFLHQKDELESVRMAAYAIKAFNQTLGSQIPEIQLQPG